MKLSITGLIALLTLAACAEVVSERPTTFTYQGRTFEAVTRTFQTDNGSYSRRSIRVGARFVTCSATDDRDCDSQIFRATISSTDR